MSKNCLTGDVQISILINAQKVFPSKESTFFLSQWPSPALRLLLVSAPAIIVTWKKWQKTHFRCKERNVSECALRRVLWA